MIRAEREGDVTCYTLTGWRNRSVKLTVNVFELRGVLVDSGFPRAARDLAAIIARVRPRGMFITHRHEDHAGNAELVAATGIPLALPAATAEALLARGSSLPCATLTRTPRKRSAAKSVPVSRSQTT